MLEPRNQAPKGSKPQPETSNQDKLVDLYNRYAKQVVDAAKSGDNLVAISNAIIKPRYNFLPGKETEICARALVKAQGEKKVVANIASAIPVAKIKSVLDRAEELGADRQALQEIAHSDEVSNARKNANCGARAV